LEIQSHFIIHEEYGRGNSIIGDCHGDCKVADCSNGLSVVLTYRTTLQVTSTDMREQTFFYVLLIPRKL